jgi:outer membrane protein insertion porin family
LKSLSIFLIAGLGYAETVQAAVAPLSSDVDTLKEVLQEGQNLNVKLDPLKSEKSALPETSSDVVPEALESFNPVLPKTSEENLPSSEQPSGTALEENHLGSKKEITTVDVQGLHRVDRQAILDHLPEQTHYSQGELDAFIKNMFKSGLFKHIEARIIGTKLWVNVQENPSIAELRFEGNSKILRSDLKEDSMIQVRDTFSTEKVSAEIKRITQMYINKGYYAVEIKASIQKLAQNRVNLIFTIKEGVVSYNKKIGFISDSKVPPFSDKRLRETITSLEARWWRILGDPAENYNSARVEEDCNLLRKHFYRHGYLDAKVTAHTQLAKNKEHFYISFYIHEGQQYKIRKVNIKSDIKHLSVDGLEEHVSLEKGDVFNAEVPEKVASRMAFDLEERGFAFVEVRPVMEKNDTTHEIDLSFVACKTQPVYVHKIHMKGNCATNDEVLRRQLRFAEGDAISVNKVNASKELLEQLDFFEDGGVDIKTYPSASNPKLQDVIVEVKEKGTGDVQFSGGYSTQDGIVGVIGLEERNLFGQALRGNIKTQLAQYGMDFRVGLANPYSFGRNLTLGGDLFFNRFRSTTKGNFDSQGSYKQSAAGTDLYAQYPLSSKLSQMWGYSIHADNISRFSPYMSPYILDNMEGKYKLLNASVQHKLDFNTANIKNGTYVSGTGAEWSTIVHGVGGEVKCVKNILSAAHYVPFNEEKTLLLKLEAQGGLINKMGYMRFSDQFTLGLFNFPGFRFSGLGPRDERTGDALYGKAYYTVSAKLYWSLGFLGIPKETPLRAVAFAYSGSVWSSIFGKKDNNAYILSQNFQNRASCGVGLIWTLPMMGNIGFLFAKPVQRKDWDQTQTFLFIWGQSF